MYEKKLETASNQNAKIGITCIKPLYRVAILKISVRYHEVFGNLNFLKILCDLEVC